MFLDTMVSQASPPQASACSSRLASTRPGSSPSTTTGDGLGSGIASPPIWHLSCTANWPCRTFPALLQPT